MLEFCGEVSRVLVFRMFSGRIYLFILYISWSSSCESGRVCIYYGERDGVSFFSWGFVFEGFGIFVFVLGCFILVLGVGFII